MLPVLSILILQGRLANVNTGVATSGSCWLHARAAETLDLPWEWAYCILIYVSARHAAARHDHRLWRNRDGQRRAKTGRDSLHGLTEAAV